MDYHYHDKVMLPELGQQAVMDSVRRAEAYMQKKEIAEKDTALDNDVNSRDYGPDVTNVRFKSPQSSITEGIELEYIYSPKYKLNANIYQNTALTHYRQSTTGTLELVDNESSYTNFNSAPNLTLSTVPLPPDPDTPINIFHISPL